MIFCAEPWYNEPGRETGTNHSESEKYNAMIQVLTARHAMLDWLGNDQPEVPENKVWADVINEHFKNRAKEIIATTQQWAKRRRSGNPLRQQAEALKRKLTSLYG